MTTTWKGYYTGVGSRKTPPEVLELMVLLGRYLCDQGWRLRSGAADGADLAFQKGAESSPELMRVGMEIFLPWSGFNDFYEEGYFISAPKLDNYEEARKIASRIHPVWDRLTRGPRAMHTRNVYQVQGLDLSTVSRSLFCYARPIGKHGQVSGGTNTAVQLALKNRIPVHNLYYEEVREKVLKLVT